MYDTKNGMSNSTLVSGLVVSLLLILFFKIGIFNPIYASFKGATESLQIANYEYFQEMQADLDFFFNIEGVRDENKILNKENSELRSKIQLQKLQLEDYSLISNQSQFNKEYHQEPVRVLRVLPNQTEIIINKGSDYQIKNNDVAVIENNLLGVVIEVNNNFAKVRLITDSNSKVPVIIQDVNLKGIAYGEKMNSLSIKDIPNNQQVSEGFTVISAGNDGVVPYGLAMGYISKVNSSPAEINQAATMISNVKFNALNSFFILVKDYYEN